MIQTETRKTDIVERPQVAQASWTPPSSSQHPGKIQPTLWCPLDSRPANKPQALVIFGRAEKTINLEETLTSNPLTKKGFCVSYPPCFLGLGTELARLPSGLWSITNWSPSPQIVCTPTHNDPCSRPKRCSWIGKRPGSM